MGRPGAARHSNCKITEAATKCFTTLQAKSHHLVNNDQNETRFHSQNIYLYFSIEGGVVGEVVL